MPYKDPAKQQEANKKWLSENRERWRAYQREYKRKWRLDHPEEQREAAKRARMREGSEKRNARHREWRNRNLETQREKDRIRGNAYRKGLRDEVIKAYGNKCACCGETMRECLSIDHIYGGGREHRHSLGGDSTSFYRFLKREGFPQDAYRCLCMNCQFAFAGLDYCPHHPPPA